VQPGRTSPGRAGTGTGVGAVVSRRTVQQGGEDRGTEAEFRRSNEGLHSKSPASNGPLLRLCLCLNPNNDRHRNLVLRLSLRLKRSQPPLPYPRQNPAASTCHTTIVLATSESDYETETDSDSEGHKVGHDDGDRDWSSEEEGYVDVVVRPDPPVPQRAQQDAVTTTAMRTNEGTAAVPVVSQIQVRSVVPGALLESEGGVGMNWERGYRPKAQPASQEMEDDSDSDSESGAQSVMLISKSVAQEKLKALAARRGIFTHQQLRKEDPGGRGSCPAVGPRRASTTDRHLAT
jgi:hypothetical protein